MIPQQNKELELSISQLDFVESIKDRVLFCGGLGSGKTFGGAIWSLMMVHKYPNTPGLITANTYSQLKKATLVSFFSLCDLLGIRYKYNINNSYIEINNTIIYCASMEKYDALRGIEVGWAWSDECAFYKKEAFDVLIGRIRDKKGPCQWKGTTTPNGFNWLYDFFILGAADNKEVIRSRTTDNMVNLPDSYVKQLKEQYDSRLSKQELDGEFVNLNSGTVYYAFDRNRHVKPVEIMPNDHLYFGMDFNVHPLCAVFFIRRGREIHIFDELYLENSNTFEAAREIQKRYPGKAFHVYADETGNRRKSSSQTTDHEILKRANFNVLGFKNPHVKDRQNNVNRLFEYNYIRISPKCKYLIKDLEQLTHDNDDPLLSHISDGMGYACWGLDPLVKPRRPATVTYK